MAVSLAIGADRIVPLTRDHRLQIGITLRVVFEHPRLQFVRRSEECLEQRRPRVSGRFLPHSQARRLGDGPGPAVCDQIRPHFSNAEIAPAHRGIAGRDFSHGLSCVTKSQAKKMFPVQAPSP
jgi:hypothetical protein